MKYKGFQVIVGLMQGKIIIKTCCLHNADCKRCCVPFGRNVLEGRPNHFFVFGMTSHASGFVHGFFRRCGLGTEGQHQSSEGESSEGKRALHKIYPKDVGSKFVDRIDQLRKKVVGQLFDNEVGHVRIHLQGEHHFTSNSLSYNDKFGFFTTRSRIQVYDFMIYLQTHLKA
ncbi:MAG: hypothetical protein Q7T46_01220 [Polaromonas sp.]|nr:hypothetical protein [Polaromonas sp.]